MTDLVLQATGLKKRFRKTEALRGVDIALPEADFVALLGPAGAGKTTLLRTIAGLEAPDGGRVEIRGRDVTALEPKDRDVAMIFDTLALYPNKTGAENIASPLRIRKLPEPEIAAKVDAVASILKVGHILRRLPKTMSGGERQRIALGRALVRDPAFFLLDEPLSSLDAQLRVELRAELRRLQKERAATILYATPDYAEALAVADTVVVLMDGKVRQVAPPQTIYDAPVDRDVARFVGAPEINLVAAHYDPSEGGQLRVGPLTTPAGSAHRALFDGASASFDAGLRPEHIELAPPGGHADTAPTGRVIDTEPLGFSTALTIDLGETQLRSTMRSEAARRFSIGDPVAVGLRADRILCFDAQDGRRIG